MIVFELSMPNKGSWNGKWSQEGQCFVRTRREHDVPKEYWNKSFYYRWDDGWTACVTTTKMTASEARKFLTHILFEIRDYARSAGQEPDETLKATAEWILAMLQIATFNGTEGEG